MKLLRKRNRVISRIIAVALVAVIAPAVLITASGNLGNISGAVNAAAEYIRMSNAETAEVSVTPVNNGALMLYMPVFDCEAPVIEELSTAVEEIPAEIETETEDEFPDAEIAAVPVMSQNISLKQDDLSRFNSNTGTVLQQTFLPRQSANHIQLAAGGQVRNRTGISEDVILKESTGRIRWTPERNSSKAEPQVLIYHTHTTESFRLSDGKYYDPSYIFRTVDSEQNIVAVGAKMAEEIAKMGFGVIHDGTFHDYPVFRGAYGRSAETVKAILREYPSIKVVLDVHRDGISDGGKPVAAVADINGKEAAQIMIISPADDGNWGIPNFMQNFRFASRLQSQMETDNPGLTRSILFQYCNYNLHLSPGALLIEVGSHGNTLEQALYAGELFGQSLGRLLIDLAET
jgi:stage II sporulation protein P